jgi:hypothetical protein
MCGDREDALAEAQVGILFLYDPRIRAGASAPPA